MNEDVRNSVLVVDDEEFNLRLLTNILHEDYTVYSASSGAEAIRAALEKTPDLILLDVLMPEMSGYEVLDTLKKNEKTRKIPIIFVTGLNSKKDEEKGLAMDAADYISKPFSVGIVMLRVRNQLQLVNQIRTIEKLSLIDQLSGIPNRRNLDNRVALEWDRARREKLPLSLMMIDIDKFKIFNDTYGHQKGDEVLKKVANSFGSSLAFPNYFAARYGGEEFSILLPDTGLNDALPLAERVRSGVERLVIDCNDGTTTKVTVSIGVHSLVPSDEDTIQDAFEKADQALYNAKETGRNRVCGYGAAALQQSAVGGKRKKKADERESAEVDTVKDEQPARPGPQFNSDHLAALKKLDGINSEEAMRRLGGKAELYCDAVFFFSKRIETNCQTMEQFLKAGDLKNFSIAVHSIKSTLVAIGAAALSEKAAKLESSAKGGDADFCLSQYPELQQKLLSLHGELSAIFHESACKTIKEPGSASALEEIVKSALAALEKFDSDEATQTVKSAVRYDFGEETNTLISNALEALKEFDAETAVSNLTKIKI